MKKLFSIVVFSLFLFGCAGRNDPEVLKENRTTLSGEGEPVGTLLDGRKVVRYPINMGATHNHWLYVVDGSVTVNHTRTTGKNSSANFVEVIIDGVKYKKVE